MSCFSLLTILTVCACYSTAYAIGPSLTYSKGPINFDQKASLYFTIDSERSTASFAIVINDPELISSTSPNWIGLGISEPSSGSMLGADVVTAQFTNASACVITDRYVPFVPYPLIEPDSNGDNTAFPLEDTCQDDGSWVLVNCEKEEGSMVLEVTRPIDAHDIQDRDITVGFNAMIYAYGESFMYHGGNRAGMHVHLRTEEGEGDGQIQDPLPDDVDGNFDIMATNYNVPGTSDTIYTCTSAVFPLDADDTRMIVAAEPILNGTTDLVHHLTLYLCSGDEYARAVESTVECTAADGEGVAGPVGNRDAQCATLIYAYTKGAGRFVIPRVAGIPVTTSRQYLVMETHYDNPNELTDVFDSSGVRVYYTDRLREHEAGSLQVGDPLVSMAGETVESGVNYEFTCPSECTSLFSQDITVFAGGLHMHTTGESIYTNRYDQDETFLNNIGQVNFWSDAFQQYKQFPSALTLRRGDQLVTACRYNTTKRPETKFGYSTSDEMCMHFLSYYPIQTDPNTGNEINICARLPLRPDEDTTIIGTACGDNGNLGISKAVLVPNPKFKDTRGAPDNFGDKRDTCSGDSTAPADPPNEGTAAASTDTSTAGTETDSPDAPSEEGEPEEPLSNSSEEAGTNENACFPGDATVRLRDGGVRRMDGLQLGDVVLCGGGEHSSVILWTHHDTQRMHKFVRLVAGNRSMEATGGHIVYANGELVKMRDVKIGDRMETDDGESAVVHKIERVWKKGLYNPQTERGDMFVDGFRASCYTEAVDVGVGHALMAVVRPLATQIRAVVAWSGWEGAQCA